MLFLFLLVYVSTACASCDCLDRSELGRSTWFLLHEIVKTPQSPAFPSLMWSLSELYPCEICRAHISEYLHQNPPIMSEYWMCAFHNVVNVRLGKPEIECIKDKGILSNE
jgi:hypothetical protein